MENFLGLILASLPIYLIRFKIFGLPTTLLEVLIGLFLLLNVIRLDRKNFDRIKNLGKINYAICLFILAAILGTIISPDKTRALGQLKAFIIEPVLLFYAARLNINEKKIKITLRWLFLGSSLVSLFGIIQYFTFVHLPLKFWGTGLEIERITSFFEHPNELALYLAPLFTFFLTLNIQNSKIFKQKWIEVAGLILMLIALTLTFSRGAWLAVALVCFLLLGKKFGIKKLVVTAIIIGLVLILIPITRSRIMLGLSDPSSQAHWQLFNLGWHKIIQNPILGTGLHSFEAFNVEYPHNIFLTFWIQMGILGLLSFCWILYLVFQSNKKQPTPLKLAASVFMLTILLQGLFDTPYFKNDLSVLFWFMVSVVYL